MKKFEIGQRVALRGDDPLRLGHVINWWPADDAYHVRFDERRCGWYMAGSLIAVEEPPVLDNKLAPRFQVGDRVAYLGRLGLGEVVVVTVDSSMVEWSGGDRMWCRNELLVRVPPGEPKLKPQFRVGDIVKPDWSNHTARVVHVDAWQLVLEWVVNPGEPFVGAAARCKPVPEGVPLHDAKFGAVVKLADIPDSVLYLVVSPMDGSGERHLVTLGGGTMKYVSQERRVLVQDVKLPK